MSMNHLVGARSRSSSKDGKGKRDPAEKYGEASTFSLGDNVIGGRVSLEFRGRCYDYWSSWGPEEAVRESNKPRGNEIKVRRGAKRRVRGGVIFREGLTLTAKP